MKLRWLWILICLLYTLATLYHICYISIKYNIKDNPVFDVKLKVCIVGNAQTKKHALAMHQMWENKFHSFWYIWDEISQENITLQNNITFIYSDDNLSWTKGIELVINVINSMKEESCDYIFTHDDDLKFRIKQQFYYPQVSLSDMLITVLQTYRPAIASFPWIMGDRSIPAMKELASFYENETLAPLTGFDNGMVIYHKSIVNFFIPFSPRGEGGFTGEWTLCAHFLQMFAHLLFRQYAVRLNMFEYYNSINIDNKLQNNNFPQRTRISKGLAYVPNSRHPYEFPQNEAYKAFLSNGLKFPYQSWGRTLTTEYRLTTLKDTGLKRMSFDGLWLLNRLNSVYDIRHEALSNNKLLHDQFTDEQKLNVLQQTNFNLKLILLTMNRSQSFQRLWKSITNAVPINRTINIFIHVDMDKDDDKRREYLDYLSSLRSLHGDVHVVAYSTQRSLKTIMMEIWRPLSNDEYAIFLEDDIEVSPYFLLYVDKLVKAYFYNLKLDKRLFGISLYNQRFNEVIEDYINVSNGHQMYAYQMPQSWGALYAPRMWRRFLDFFKNKFDPFIPDSYTNRWPYKRSWKKYLLRFMYQEQGCLLYPNFPYNLSLSTNHLEYGMNNKLSKTSDTSQLRVKFNIPLLYNKEIIEQLETPSFDDLQIYSVYHKRVKSLNDLKVSEAKLTSFDKCTMILTVYDRTNTTLNRLAYYQNFTYLSAIIVVWNNIDVQPITVKKSSKFRIPVHVLKMTNNSLNNRFYPHKQIQTDCIINMDDDWDMPYSHMAFAIDTWRGHFFYNLVGFSHLGRNHVPIYINRTLKYSYSNKILSSKKGPFFSIVLPSGFVYHRRYLYQYTYGLPQIARDIVDSRRNCDDILFNFLIANTTKQGPVVIDASAKAYNFGGLWKRPTHMETRTLCLNKFVEIFGGMPLKYTMNMFKIDRNQTVPGRDKHIFQDKIPIKQSVLKNT